MAHIKNLSNRAYISGSLKDKLSRFEMYNTALFMRLQDMVNPK